MSEKVEYPKFLFKSNAPDVVAQTFESHQEYSADGYMTADEFDALPPAAPIEATVADAPATGPEIFEALSAVDAIERINEAVDAETLRGYRASEENRAGGGRTTVLRALAKKLGDSIVADQSE